MDFTLPFELASKLVGKTEDELKADLYSGEGEDLKQNDDSGEAWKNLLLDRFKQSEREKVKAMTAISIRKEKASLDKVLKPLFEKYGVDESELVAGVELLSKKLEQRGKPGKLEDLTAEQLKTHPSFQSVLDEEVGLLNEKLSTLETKYNSYVSETEAAKKLSKLIEVAEPFLEKSKAVWGDSRQQQLKFFFRGIDTNLIHLEGDEIVLKNPDGTPLRDEYKSPITYEKFILDNWTQAGYSFHEAPPGSSSPGIGKDGKGGGAKIVINSPQHYEELLNQYRNDHEKRSEIRKAWANQLSVKD